ncbi:glutathione S-transferase A-like [Salarias fasciatus]|uniref:Glutathione S-transferase A-like n=1 Tax=Salarias fasciatus TaxID=181472 RepID=A0A672H5Y3_SALFA|nr:glutathione S-transferase A-like [Salarias fasciatus]
MAESMSLLWGSGSGPCWRVMLALEEKKLQGYRHKLISFEKNEHKSQEVLEINPRGELPAFKHGDIILNQSTGACLYLENQFKSQGTKLIPDDPAKQAMVYQRMMEGLVLTEKINWAAYYNYMVPEGERHEAGLQRHRDALTTELKLWEGYLENVAEGSYLAGPFSLADVIGFPNAAYAFAFGLSPERYPKLAKYYNLLKDRPSIKATWPPKWFESELGFEALKDV